PELALAAERCPSLAILEETLAIASTLLARWAREEPDGKVPQVAKAAADCHAFARCLLEVCAEDAQNLKEKLLPLLRTLVIHSKALPPGGIAWVPVGWLKRFWQDKAEGEDGGHFLLIVLVRHLTDEDFTLSVVNTGDGLQYHPVRHCGKAPRPEQPVRQCPLVLCNVPCRRVTCGTFWYLLFRQLVSPSGSNGPRLLYSTLLPAWASGWARGPLGCSSSSPWMPTSAKSPKVGPSFVLFQLQGMAPFCFVFSELHRPQDACPVLSSCLWRHRGDCGVERGRTEPEEVETVGAMSPLRLVAWRALMAVDSALESESGAGWMPGSWRWPEWQGRCLHARALDVLRFRAWAGAAAEHARGPSRVCWRHGRMKRGRDDTPPQRGGLDGAPMATPSVLGFARWGLQRRPQVLAAMKALGRAKRRVRLFSMYTGWGTAEMAADALRSALRELGEDLEIELVWICESNVDKCRYLANAFRNVQYIFTDASEVATGFAREYRSGCKLLVPFDLDGGFVGYPCVDLSSLNNGPGQFTDTATATGRGYANMLSVVDRCSGLAFLGVENSANMWRKRKQDEWRRPIDLQDEAFRGRGFVASSHCVSAHEFGPPQSRRRSWSLYLRRGAPDSELQAEVALSDLFLSFRCSLMCLDRILEQPAKPAAKPL
ncbi:unnamed protein product, partial [Effrenium voratum]